MDEVMDRLLDALAEKIAERLEERHKDLYSARELAERYGVSGATIRAKMARGEFGALVQMGDRTRLVPWAGVKAYDDAHSGLPRRRQESGKAQRASTRRDPGPI